MALDLTSLLSDRGSDAEGSVIRELLKHAQQPDVISLAGGIPDPAYFPVEQIRSAFDDVLADTGPAAFQYDLTGGVAEFRVFLAEHETGRGMPATPDQVVVTTGSQQGLDLLARSLVNPGDPVVVDDPAYVGATQALAGYGPEFIGIPVDADGMQTDLLADRLAAGLRPKLLYTNPAFQNPTGAALSAERRVHLAELAERYGFIVVDDDPYGDLRYDGEHLPPVGPGSEHIVRLRTVSKTVVPGFRLGWVVASPELTDHLIVAKQAVDLHTSGISQRIIHRVIAEPGWWVGHVEELVSVYGERRDALVDALDQTFGDAITYDRPKGGMFIWAKLHLELPTEKLLEVALEQGVAFVPGFAFAVDTPASDRLRLSFVTVPPEVLGEGVARLAAAVEAASRT